MTAGGTTFEYDREATRAAYALIPVGGADRCTCAGCRNFQLVRESAIYPPDFLLLLDTLGIDFRKEEEAYHMGDVTNGKMLYGGQFYFVGRLSRPEPRSRSLGLPPAAGQIKYGITDDGGTPQDAFAGHPTITIHFMLHAPWQLAEPY